MGVRAAGTAGVPLSRRRCAGRAGRQRALLASLLADANRTVPVSELYRRLWDTELPPDARTTLQTYVSRLRRALAAAGDGSLIITRPGGYLIEAAAGRWT